MNKTDRTFKKPAIMKKKNSIFESNGGISREFMETAKLRSQSVLSVIKGHQTIIREEDN